MNQSKASPESRKPAGQIGRLLALRAERRGLAHGDGVELCVDGGDAAPDLDDLGLAAPDRRNPDLGPAFLDDGLDLANGGLDLPQPLPLVGQDRDRQRPHLFRELVAQHRQRRLTA